MTSGIMFSIGRELCNMHLNRTPAQSRRSIYAGRSLVQLRMGGSAHRVTDLDFGEALVYYFRLAVLLSNM